VFVTDNAVNTAEATEDLDASCFMVIAPTPSPSPTPSPFINIFSAYFIGGAAAGQANGIARDENAKLSFTYAFAFPTNDGRFAVDEPEAEDAQLVNFDRESSVKIFWPRDINCGQSAFEGKCSCESTCGDDGEDPCCANFHRPTLALFSNGFQQLLEEKAISYKVTCNDAWISHIFIGFAADSGIYYVDSLGREIWLYERTKWQNGEEDAGSDSTLLYYFLPDHTVTNNAQAVNYCKPSTTNSGANIVANRDINYDTTCTNLCNVQSFGGCFCSSDCGTSADGHYDCCNDIYADMCGDDIYDPPLCPNLGVLDCDGNCVDAATAASMIGDGNCDAQFNCPSQYHTNYDAGDCVNTAS
jgi:hypothetical protein